MHNKGLHKQYNLIKKITYTARWSECVISTKLLKCMLTFLITVESGYQVHICYLVHTAY